MNFFESHLVLTFLIVWPLVGAVTALLVANESAKRVALAFGVVELLAAIPLFWSYDPMGAPFQNG